MTFSIFPVLHESFEFGVIKIQTDIVKNKIIPNKSETKLEHNLVIDYRYVSLIVLEGVKKWSLHHVDPRFKARLGMAVAEEVIKVWELFQHVPPESR
jgi:hypothetical protein